MRICLTTLLILHALIAGYSQKKYDNWGVISQEDLDMTVYDKDSLAPAVILHDVGDIRVLTDHKGDWVVDHTHIRRIKIFDVSALKEGNLFIPYRADRSVEKMLELDVQVFLPNGNLVKVKSDNVFTERLSKHWMAKKVFIPNLQKGCVIEYRYTVSSEYIFALYDWNFQDDMPIRWSEVKVSIPQYFNYVMLLRVAKPLETKDTDKDYTDVGRDGRSFLVVESKYGKGDIPAIKSEPFITTLDDYREQISFQLSRVTFPGRPSEQFMSTWENLAKRIEEGKDMGDQYKKNNNSDALWKAFSPLITPDATPEQLMEKARVFVSSQIKWDGAYRDFTDRDLDKSFEIRQGSTADINYAVVALLRRAGLDAVPVLISTVDNGRPQPEYPFLRQFNSVVACVREGEKRTLIDASSPFLPVGQMQLKHCNKEGWIVDRKKPEWIKIKPAETAMTWLGNLRLSEDGALSGKFEIQVTGTVAADWREDWQQLNETAFLKKYFQNGLTEIRYDSVAVTDGENLEKPFRVSFFMEAKETVTRVNDFLYFRPVIDYTVMGNPFKAPARKLPVSFPFPFKANYVLNLQLPAGFQAADIPKPERINIPGDIGRITFNASADTATPDLVRFSLRTMLNETEFAPENYEPLRTFFNHIAEKTDMQLVFKKTN